MTISSGHRDDPNLLTKRLIHSCISPLLICHSKNAYGVLERHRLNTIKVIEWLIYCADTRRVDRELYALKASRP